MRIFTYEIDDVASYTFPMTAILILISDFGTEGRTENMPYEDVKRLVETDAKKFWINTKQTDAITRILLRNLK